MNFGISIAREAEKLLDRLDRQLEHRIRARFTQLAVDPLDARLSTPLTARPGIRKSRVGGWRILFTVALEARMIYVITVDSRGQVYKHL